jgi:hypothetical protein
MTVVAIMAGLLPILWSTGTGADGVGDAIERDAIGLQLLRIDDHLILFLETADAGDLGNTLCRDEVVANDPVLDAAQLGARGGAVLCWRAAYQGYSGRSIFSY